MAHTEICPTAHEMTEEGTAIVAAFAEAHPGPATPELHLELAQHPRIKELNGLHASCPRYRASACYLKAGEVCLLFTRNEALHN